MWPHLSPSLIGPREILSPESIGQEVTCLVRSSTDILTPTAGAIETETSGIALTLLILAIPVVTVVAIALATAAVQRFETAARLRQAETAVREADAALATARARLVSTIVDKVIAQEECDTSQSVQIAIVQQASPNFAQRPALIGNMTVGLSRK